MRGESRSNSFIDKRKLTPVVVGSENDTCCRLATNERMLSSNLELLVRAQSEGQLRKKETLHKKWDENVYRPISRRIKTQLKRDFTGFMQRKMEMYEHYLDVLNEKEQRHCKNHVFLDVDTVEYDALRMQRSAITTLVGHKRDPTKVNQRHGQEELNLLRPNRCKIARCPTKMEPNTLWRKSIVADIRSSNRCTRRSLVHLKEKEVTFRSGL